MTIVATDKEEVRFLYIDQKMTAKQVALKLHKSISRIRNIIEQEKFYKVGARGIQTKSSERAVTVMNSNQERLSQAFLSIAL